MSSLPDVSAKLGQYMLQGWVLTDQPCTTPGCIVPLMRSPNGRKPVSFFCANCDVKSDAASLSNSSSGIASDSYVSRPSTPPTEVSSVLSSPVFAPPADTEEIRLRRQQSDTAAVEIGNRLLKGWAMLGDECPNPRCFGVPLVRPPKAGGDKDPRKECVICGSIYVTESDWDGRGLLVAVDSNPGVRNDASGTAMASNSQGEGMAKDTSDDPQPDPTSLAFPIVLKPAVHTQPETLLARTDASLQVLDEASQALQFTLHTLSARLTTLSSPEIVIDPSSIGSVADTIGKVSQALLQVRQLQWSENQARKL